MSKETEVKTFSVHVYGENNKDDLTEAVHGLDIFTKNYCMDVKRTNEENDLIFRCQGCSFCTPNENCLIKLFAYQTEKEHNYPLSDFGAMGML